MRIAVFIKRTTFHEGFGGLETQNKLLCEGLAEKGHDITVFSPKWKLEIEKKTEKGVDYVFIPCVFRSLFSGILKNHWYNKSYEALVSHLESQDFDLIVSQSSAGIGIIKHKKDIHIPIITISHGSTMMEFKTLLQSISGFKDVVKLIPNTLYTLYNLFNKQKSLIKNSDKVIAVSRYVAKTLSRETLSPKGKFIVVHNGVDPSRFEHIEHIYKEKSDIDEELADILSAPNFLYLGQVQKSKGLDYFINIVEDPRFKDIHIDIVGDGDYLDSFKNKVTKKGLNSFFTFHGKVEYDKVIYFYNRAYAFLFPTKRYEGLPMVLIEAMFNSLPIIAFNKGGVSDAVSNNETGYLIKAGNIKNFKNSMSKLLNNNDLRNSMSIKTLEKAQKEFTIELMLDKYEEIFEGFVK